MSLIPVFDLLVIATLNPSLAGIISNLDVALQT